MSIMFLCDKTNRSYCFISKERSDEGVNGDEISEEEERQSKFQTEVYLTNFIFISLQIMIDQC